MNIDIRSCDDWVAVYKNGRKVWENHSCGLREGLEALGIDFSDEEMEVDEYGDTSDGSDPWPEFLP